MLIVGGSCFSKSRWPFFWRWPRLQTITEELSAGVKSMLAYFSVYVSMCLFAIDLSIFPSILAILLCVCWFVRQPISCCWSTDPSVLSVRLSIYTNVAKGYHHCSKPAAANWNATVDKMRMMTELGLWFIRLITNDHKLRGGTYHVFPESVSRWQIAWRHGPQATPAFHWKLCDRPISRTWRLRRPWYKWTGITREIIKHGWHMLSYVVILSLMLCSINSHMLKVKHAVILRVCWEAVTKQNGRFGQPIESKMFVN